MNKKIYIGMLFSSMMLAACGGSSATDPDDVSSSNSTATNGTDFSEGADYSVESYESLPACNDKKEGQTGYVTGTSKLYVCEDGEWVVTSKPSSPSSSASEDESGDGPFAKSSESSEANAGGYDPSTGTLTDSRDGQKYKTTVINKQVWMAENLNYAYLQPTTKLDSSSFCYDNDPANCKKYGRLYLWSAAIDSAAVLKNDGKGKGCGYGVECDVQGRIQGICPSGWHLPSKDEFKKLFAFVGEDADKKLRAESGWDDGKNGMDLYGFSALPAGYYGSYSKKFYYLGDVAGFWSSSEDDSYHAYRLRISDNDADVNVYGKDLGYSVRCLQDSN